MKTKNKRLNQSGFASMVIALVLVLLMSLLTVAFTQLSRREQKSSLDKQLASQAYFAAETGINDVIEKITDKIDDPSIDLSGVEANKCLTDDQLNTFNLNPKIDPSRGISYSCVMVDATPATIDFTNVYSNSEKNITFKATGDLGSFDITWTNTSPGSNNLRNDKKFAKNVDWKSPAVLQVYLTPITTGSMDALANDTFVTFLYPANSSVAGSPRGSVPYSTDPNGQGLITLANCSVSAENIASCKATINNLAGGQPYLIRIVDYYSNSDITIGNAKATDNTTPLRFKDAQAKIDVTGRARDVLKRIRVSSPLNQGSLPAKDSVEAQNLCKRITTEPSSSYDDTSIPQCNIWAPSTP